MTALKLDHSKPPYYYISSVGNTTTYILLGLMKKENGLFGKDRGQFWLKFEFFTDTLER